jgi:hypothetical protein
MRVYFWRMKDLKRRLVTTPLSDREALPYLVAYTAVTATVTLVPPENINGWDVTSGLAGVGFAICGPIWVYQQNGGRTGTHLLQRFMAIGWVLLLRLSVLVVPALLVFSMVAFATFKQRPGTDWYDVIIIVVMQLVFYHRLGSHVRDVALALRGRPLQPTSGTSESS